MKKNVQPTGRLIVAARALLRWSQDDLAKASGLARQTIKTAERDFLSVSGASQVAIHKAINSHGVTFALSKGEGMGVRYTDPAQ